MSPPTSGLRATVLGSGTSTGVPVIGCHCAVCRSADPRNRRLRPGLKLEIGGAAMLVDTPTDLREQLLRFGLERLDAVLFTHPHADHIFGLDELRIFNFRQQAPIPCYGSSATLAAIRRTFAYAFEEGQEGGGRPRLELKTLEGATRICDREVIPIPVWHGDMPVLGYRIGGFAYVTDVSRIPEESARLLSDLEVLVLGALRYRPHPTHLSIPEALQVVDLLQPRRTIFTHLAHDVDHGNPALPLPQGVELGFDGLVVELR